MSTHVLESARKVLNGSIVYYRGNPVGTLAAVDDSAETVNYDQVFTRDFAVSAFAFLLEGRTDIVKNFLLQAVELQSREKHFDCFRASRGLMPASFKIEKNENVERIVPDFGEKAIAKVAPVDASFWWIYILRAYVKAAGDPLHTRPEVQESIRLILDLALTHRFDMLPTLLVPDGSFMIDRRMGVYGHPLDIQALFYIALRSSYELLEDNETNQPYRHGVRERLGHLTYHMRHYYWLDFRSLNELYRSQVEQYGEGAGNRFNIYPATIPDWLPEWLPSDGGYFAGNLGPARMDFRFFTSGNLLTIVSSLAESRQTQGIMQLLHNNWAELVGNMPLKVCYPALEGEQWKTLTGADPKNIAWSYQNAGAWPFLLWQLAAAGLKSGRTDLAQEALTTAESCIAEDRWPEYYDGRSGRLVGKEAKLKQTWSAAGYIIARRLLEKPQLQDILVFPESSDILACSRRIAGEIEGES